MSDLCLPRPLHSKRVDASLLFFFVIFSLLFVLLLLLLASRRGVITPATITNTKRPSLPGGRYSSLLHFLSLSIRRLSDWRCSKGNGRWGEGCFRVVSPFSSCASVLLLPDRGILDFFVRDGVLCSDPWFKGRALCSRRYVGEDGRRAESGQDELGGKRTLTCEHGSSMRCSLSEERMFCNYRTARVGLTPVQFERKEKVKRLEEIQLLVPSK